MKLSLTSLDHRMKQKPFWLNLLMVSYLLVSLFSVSHTHEEHGTEEINFSSKILSFYQELSLENHADHWHSDQHHSAGCKLLSQTPAESVELITASSFTPVQLSQTLTNPTEFPTPTKKLTRAPPRYS